MDQKLFQALKVAAGNAGLDPILLAAIISTESSWRPAVTRFESNAAKYVITPQIFADKNGYSLAEEMIAQQTSYGLSQVMGYNYRDMGFVDNLKNVLDPYTNIHYFCRFFVKHCSKYSVMEDKIAAYNAGSPRRVSGKYVNQQYVDKVLSFYPALTLEP